MEIDNDVQRLKLLKASYDNQRYGLQDNFMIKYPKLIKTATERESFLYQCLDTAPMSVMKAMV